MVFPIPRWFTTSKVVMSWTVHRKCPRRERRQKKSVQRIGMSRDKSQPVAELLESMAEKWKTTTEKFP